MKHDPKLEWQYQLYQDYVAIAEIICQAVEMIMQQQDETALKYLVIAKEQTVKWKEHLWRRNHTHNIDALFDGSSFLFTIQKLGKHVLSVGIFSHYLNLPLGYQGIRPCNFTAALLTMLFPVIQCQGICKSDQRGIQKTRL
jgi:hypothetical protein